ncbi:MAG: MoaD family protein [Euryarchaeota archaeon]|nr:MoaD family protein [Euryarchaeota archaeon]
MFRPQVPVDDVDVTVRFFAAYRELTGLRETRVALADGATLGDLLARVFEAHPKLARYRPSMLLAVNQEFADPGVRLKAGDEVALLPPVSGGRAGVDIRRKAIDVEAVVDSVHRHDAGAVVLFLGTVRADPGVKALDYEVYRPMALKKMGEIVELAKQKFGVLEMSIVHRLGRIPVGRPSVAVACSAAHRQEAFQACAWAMEELKQIVPVWKTERG